MEKMQKLEYRRRLVRTLRRCTPPTNEELARRCPKQRCPWRRDGIPACVLPVCMERKVSR